MSVQFPTKFDDERRGGGAVGFPERARGCRCGDRQRLGSDGECFICGRFPRETVDKTFAQQAWHNQKAARPKSKQPYRFDAPTRRRGTRVVEHTTPTRMHRAA
jgi:hypothetical protein